jgi:hypothetical protein
LAGYYERIPVSIELPVFCILDGKPTWDNARDNAITVNLAANAGKCLVRYHQVALAADLFSETK